MLVPNRGVDLVYVYVVHRRDPVARFAGGDELGDCLCADSAVQGGFTEAVVGVEDDGDGAPRR